MCNLNVLIKKRNDEIDYTAFLMSVTSSSFADNDDGDGVYFNSSDRIEKGENKVNILKHNKEVNESSVIITHQRISTSGRTAKYTQPFMDENIVLAHNGILTYTEVKGKSDTFVMFEKLSKLFKERLNDVSLTISREKKLIKSIQEVFGDESGSWSIIIYDKINETLFYFKSSTTTINFYSFKDMIFITTSRNNDIFLPLVTKRKPSEYNIVSENLYKIMFKKNKLKLYDTTEEIKGKVWNTGYNYYNSSYKDGKWNDISSDNKIPITNKQSLTLIEAEASRFSNKCKNDFNRDLFKTKTNLCSESDYNEFEETLKEEYDSDYAEYMKEYSDEYDGEKIRVVNFVGKFVKDRFGQYLNKYNTNIYNKIEKLIKKEEQELFNNGNLETKLTKSIIPGKIVSPKKQRRNIFGRKIVNEYDDHYSMSRYTTGDY